MSNQTTGNPIIGDTAGVLIADDTDGVLVQSMQWTDDSTAGVTAADTCVFVMDGVTVSLLCTIALCEMWTVNFAKPIRIKNLSITTIDGGALRIWKA